MKARRLAGARVRNFANNDLRVARAVGWGAWGSARAVGRSMHTTPPTVATDMGARRGLRYLSCRLPSRSPMKKPAELPRRVPHQAPDQRRGFVASSKTRS